MPKTNKKQSLTIFLIKPFLKAALYILLFLIFIGDQLRYFLNLILSSLIRIIKYLNSLSLKFYRGCKSLSKIKIQLAKPSLKFPKISLPKPKLPEIKILANLRLKLKYFFLGVVLSFFIIFIQQGYQFIQSLPNPSLIGAVNYPVSTQLFDRRGKLLYEIYRDQNRTPIKLKDIPSYTKQATIAIEDKDFYKHKGVSFFSGITRAVKDMILTKTLQGGSTITQQLVKSALLTPERTIQRKIKEIILALWAERIFSKDEILEMYLNQVPYGGSAYGIEEAAKTYFDKKAKDLTLSEAAFLAGLPQAPSLYSPYVNPLLAKERQKEVLKNMYETKYISWQEYQKELDTPLEVKPPQNVIRAPHFVFYVKSILEQQYGIHQIEEGGFRVITSLNLEIQEKAEEILREELKKIKDLNITNGGVLITVPSTGEILAMVGSKDYFATTGAFNVTEAQRQPGSSIKPLMYSLALEKGYTAATIINDSPVVFNILGSELYAPVNYDNRFHGLIPLRYALANSYNVPAVKVLYTLGVDQFIKQAQKIGITTWNNPERYGLSLTLGGGEVKMTDMAVAFGVFANRGRKVNLNPLLKISDYRNNLLFQLDQENSKRVINEEIAFIISNILSDSFARRFAFGTLSSLDIPNFKVAVKTGTTNDKKDNWTIGYTPQFLTAVWVGNNDNSPMNPQLTSGITGAAPIWNKVMSHLLQRPDLKEMSIAPLPEDDFKEPENIVKKNCYFGRTEYFIKGTENTVSCRENLFKVSPTTSVSP